MVALCKFTLVYILNSTKVRVGTGVKARVKAQKATGVGVKVLSPSVETSETFSASLFLLIREKLQQVDGPAI